VDSVKKEKTIADRFKETEKRSRIGSAWSTNGRR